MKIRRQDRTPSNARVKRRFTAHGLVGCLMIMLITLPRNTLADQDVLPPQPTPSDPAPSDPRAEQLIQQVIERLAHGKAFDCKVRQRVRTSGREVVGVGTYQQVGEGTGQFVFQIKMHDGDGKHTLQQTSDGRLAWTRTEIAGVVSLSRVDVGWLDEGARTLGRTDRVKPSMLVGGPSEMLDMIRREYDLKLGTSEFEGRPLLVVIGTLKSALRSHLESTHGAGTVEKLYPTRVNVAIAQEDDPETGFGKGLPVRIEHLSDPRALSDDPDKALESQLKRRRMISLLELYSIRPIAKPPIERFDNRDTEIDFVNETGRYESRFNIQVSAKDRARYR